MQIISEILDGNMLYEIEHINVVQNTDLNN